MAGARLTTLASGSLRAPRRLLVQLDQERPVASVSLRREECIVGRDASADLCIDDARISRRHVRVRRGPGGHLASDLGSSNGTTLNGTPLSGEVALVPGDRLELGGTVLLCYEHSPRRAFPLRGVLAALALAALVALGGAAFWRVRGQDPVLEQATLLAREASAAAERGDSELAKRRLQDAAGLLFREGRLDDVERGEVMRAALERLGERVGGGVDLVAIFRASFEVRAEEPEPPRARAACRLDEPTEPDVARCVRSASEAVLAALYQDPAELPESFYQAVEQELVVLAGRRQLLLAALERGRRHVPMLRRELERAHMPPLLHYLALIESAYQTDVTSRAGARGIWQFVPETARRYGLAVNPGVDERTDPEKSTRAAARYLNHLTFEFGGDSLLLVVAAYNKGENGIQRVLRKLSDPFADRSYSRLAESNLLPEETRAYVPRFVAAAVLGEWGVPSEPALAALAR